MLKVSFGRLKPAYDTRIIHFYYVLYAKADLAWTKKHSLRNEKLKANRASGTEEQMKETDERTDERKAEDKTQIR